MTLNNKPRIASCILTIFSFTTLLGAQQIGQIEHLLSYQYNDPLSITKGPDGALWFTENSGLNIGRIATDGTITEYPYDSGHVPEFITAGSDGALWFTQGFQFIGRMTTAGVYSQYTIPGTDSTVGYITSGPDGALWFTESEEADSIVRLTTSGEFTIYPIPTSGAGASGITTGPDGALWFTESFASQIGRITTGGVITEYPITANTGPSSIVTGPDGALWFTEDLDNSIGRITTTGSFTEYPLTQTTILLDDSQIIAGPDGALWFGDAGNRSLSRMTTSGALLEYPIPTNNALPIGITTGPDGAIWYTEEMKIGQAVFETAVVSATPDTGKVGSEVMLSGTGFAPGEQVNLFGNSTSKDLLDTANADESGSFAVSRPVAQAGFGPESVTGVGQTSGKLGVAPYTIQARLVLSPVEGAPGATIEGNGYGFDTTDQLDVFWTGPGGRKTEVGVADPNLRGSSTFTFVIPKGTPTGQGYITLQGFNGDVARAYLTVQ
jgi:virginiamycin B lyase